MSGDKFLYFSADRASKPLDMGDEELTSLLRRPPCKGHRQGKYLLPQMASQGSRYLGQPRPAAYGDVLRKGQISPDLLWDERDRRAALPVARLSSASRSAKRGGGAR